MSVMRPGRGGPMRYPMGPGQFFGWLAFAVVAFIIAAPWLFLAVGWLFQKWISYVMWVVS